LIKTGLSSFAIGVLRKFQSVCKETNTLIVSSLDGSCEKFLILLQSQKKGSVLANNWIEQSVYAAIFTNEGV
jgi:hypothetical protein